MEPNLEYWSIMVQSRRADSTSILQGTISAWPEDVDVGEGPAVLHDIPTKMATAGWELQSVQPLKEGAYYLFWFRRMKIQAEK